MEIHLVGGMTDWLMGAPAVSQKDHVMYIRPEFMHELKYVNWRKEAKLTNLKWAEMDKKMAQITQLGHIASSKTERKHWLKDYTYSVDQRGYIRYVYVKEPDGYHIYTTHIFDDSKNLNAEFPSTEHSGRTAQKIENELFKKYNGVSERAAFGYCDRKLINRCIPKQLYYINKSQLNRNLKHISKADYSSHYPDHQRGRMPDWHGKKVVEGTVKPTAEYPFAFYVRSGHCAEFKRFDTHNWMAHRLNFELFGDRVRMVDADKDQTILCKASKYTYDDVVNELYEKKLNGEKIGELPAKEVLNKSIGYKHQSHITSDICRLDHIAAVVIARANQQMVELFDQLQGRVLQLIVDSVIYNGTKAIGVDYKSLGCLYQEFTDCDFRMRGQNAYVFFKDGKLLDQKNSGYNDNLIVTKLEDIDNWSKS